MDWLLGRPVGHEVYVIAHEVLNACALVSGAIVVLATPSHLHCTRRILLRETIACGIINVCRCGAYAMVMGGGGGVCVCVCECVCGGGGGK